MIMPPRISPVTDPDEDVRDRLSKTPRGDDGRPLNLFATLAHRPRLMSRVNALGGSLMFASSIPARERELVILRTASLGGCGYEIHHHRVLAAAAGLEPAEIEAAIDPSLVHGWSSDDRALLAVAEQIDARADVDDAGWEALDGVLDEPQRIDLLVLIGFYRMLAGALNGARVEVDDLVMEAR
jgi:4-carboxymuconolactone decarboxylase